MTGLLVDIGIDLRLPEKVKAHIIIHTKIKNLIFKILSLGNIKVAMNEDSGEPAANPVFQILKNASQ